MSNMTNYLEGEVIKHIFRTGSFAKPTVLAVGLFTAVADAEAGTVTEVTGNGYARAQRDPLDANWAAPSAGNGLTSNVAALTFPTPTGAGWGTVTHFGIFDALSGGNLLFVSPALSPSQTISAGNTVQFNANQLTVTVA